LFYDDDWDGDWIDHHSDAQLWAESIVSDSCPICTLLWQKLQAVDASQLVDQSDSSKEAQIQHIKQALLTSLLPVFRVRLRKLANGDFLLSFQSDSNSDSISAVTQVVTVNFMIYPLDGVSSIHQI
jgi:hypothetical protein